MATKRSQKPRPGDLGGTPIIRFVGEIGRHEADTFTWENLTKWQQNAVLRCHLRLMEMARVPRQESKPRTHAARFLPKIDSLRMNNAVLIDGRRGSGKTIVLFTLLRYWIASSRFSNLLADQNESQELCRKIQWALNRLRNAQIDDQSNAAQNFLSDPVQVVPIGPVDLQYLSPATQIIPLIAGAFHDVVQGLREIRGVSDDQKEPPPWTSLPGDSASISEKWRDLVASASAWEVNSATRHSRIDPEEYVIEVSEMESHRARLQGKFRAFADALYQDYQATFRAEPEPLFVLCIDDADMKPAVSVRLLEAMRVLYHPRVAFLLTGNSDLFINMLTDSFFAGLRSPLLRLDLAGDQPDEMNDRSFALRLAREVYGKVIPTGHRIEVPRVPSDERYRVLNNVVREVKKVSPRALLETLAREDDPEREDNVDRPDDEGDYVLEYYLRHDKYTLNALPEQLREMWSLRDFVRDYIERAAAGVADEADTSPSVGTSTAGWDDKIIHHQSLPIRVVQKLWLDALEDALLSRSVLDLLRKVIRFETRPHFRFFVDNTPLHKNILSVALLDARRADGSSTSLRRIVGYEIYVEISGVRDVLTEAAEGALILATNLAADYKAGDFVAAPLSPDEFDNPFVTMGIPNSAAAGIIDVVWPLPDWDAFIDFHIFSDRWEEVVSADPELRGSSRSEPDVALLARRFLNLVLQMIQERTFTSDSSSQQNLTWADLASRIVKVGFELPPRRHSTGRVLSRDVINNRWARSRAILLAAPESKLPRSDAEEFLHEFKSTIERLSNHDDIWQDVRRDVQLARRARLERSYVHSGKERGKPMEQLAQAAAASGSREEALRQQLDRVIEEITDEEHPWNRYFGEQPR